MFFLPRKYLLVDLVILLTLDFHCFGNLFHLLATEFPGWNHVIGLEQGRCWHISGLREVIVSKQMRYYLVRVLTCISSSQRGLYRLPIRVINYAAGSLTPCLVLPLRAPACAV